MEYNVVTDPGGFKIRIGYMRHPNPIGTVVVCLGYRQIIEQYEDIAQKLYDASYSVYLFDWKGQGGSDRYLDDKSMVHCEGFEDHIETLDNLVRNVVVRDGDSLTLLAHSMGGNIALRYLKEYPDVFDKAVLVATMVGFDESVLSKDSVKVMTDFAASGGTLDSAVPEMKLKTFEKSAGLLDRPTVKKIFKAFKGNPDLITKTPTIGFLQCVLESIDVVKSVDATGKPYLNNVETPIMWLVPEDDKMVPPSYQEEMAGLLANATCVFTSGGHNALFGNDNLMCDVISFMNEANVKAEPSIEVPPATVH